MKIDSRRNLTRRHTPDIDFTTGIKEEQGITITRPFDPKEIIRFDSQRGTSDWIVWYKLREDQAGMYAVMVG